MLLPVRNGAALDDESDGRDEANSTHRLDSFTFSLGQLEDSVRSNKHGYDAVVARSCVAHVARSTVNNHHALL